MKIKLIILLISVLPISLVSAALLGTTESVELESNPTLSKIGNIAQFTARSLDYSSILPIDGVAIRLQSSSKPTVNFRFKDASAIWSEWQKAKLFQEPLSERWLATYSGDIAKTSTQFELEINVPENEIVEILEQGVFPADTEIYPKNALQPAIYPTEIPAPNIVTRQEWGARPPAYGYTNMPYYTKLTLHHAAGFNAENLAEGKLQVRAIQDFHIDGRKWSDIAYHFLVDRAGNIFQGRPETVIGAHTLDNNTGNIGVCILGCYDPPYEVSTGVSCHQHLTQESRDALVHLYAWIIERFDYGNADILKGHRDYYDYPHTSCPGQNIHQLLPELRTEINDFIKFGGPPFDYSVTDNYPNPFNSTTNIEYALPVESTVDITIFNSKGEEVITIIEGEVQSKGTYTVTWNGIDSQDKLSHTGVYFYRIEAHQDITSQIGGNYSETGKMLFLK